MAGSRITGTVTQTVVIGTSQYPSPLIVSHTGVIYPGSYGSNAISCPAGLSAVSVVNRGEVEAAQSGSKAYMSGGIGIDLQSPATLSNTGTILGGYGGLYQGAGGGGGGVLLSAGGYVRNGGSIVGGAAGYASADGGAGVDISQVGTLINQGLVRGGYGGVNYDGGNGGNGVIITSGTLANHGIISGGAGGGGLGDYGTGGYGASGVFSSGAATIVNTGLITGGTGGFGGNYSNTGVGGLGVDISGGGIFSNSGTIQGGNSAEAVLFSGDGTLTNSGVLAGGAPRYVYYYQGGPAALGLDIAKGSNAMITNTGSISGVYLGGRDNLTDAGKIVGGSGGYNKYDSGAPSGRAGILALGDSTITVTSKGSIEGGNGGHDKFRYGGYGGPGVFISGGTLSVAGTISGGAGGSSDGVADPAGDAVQFGTLAGTLAMTSKAVFHGDIVADSAVNDTLVLDAGSPGTVSGLGTTITGFSTIEEAAKAVWTLQGTLTGTAAIDIDSGAKLTIDAPVSVPAIAFNGPADLTLDEPNDATATFSGFSTGDIIKLIGIKATSLTFKADTMTLLNANGTIVDTLTFTGKYHRSDFALQSLSGNTEIIFAGPDVLPNGPLQDFQPGATAPAATYATMSARQEDAHGASHMATVSSFELPQPWHGHILSAG